MMVWQNKIYTGFIKGWEFLQRMPSFHKTVYFGVALCVL